MHASSGTLQWFSWLFAILGILPGWHSVSAILVDMDDPESIKNAASVAAYGMVKWYNGNMTGGVPGNLPSPYYWWEAGAMMMNLVEYWYYTGDTQYNNITAEAILWQVGPNRDFMTPNQTRTTGNDDQSFWAFAALDAAEMNFPNPPADQPQWLALAQSVFNLQAFRWDDANCGGGLRWQVINFNPGFDYKNTISNGCFFSMGARLARYTNNQTYADYAEKMWNWVEAIGLMTEDYQLWDGTDVKINCSDVNRLQWSYNVGIFLHGAANMWNFTQDEKWKTRVDGILDGMGLFFSNSVMIEQACESQGNCNNDQLSFKAYFARWLAATTQLAPWTASTILPLLKTSGAGAAAQCSGGEDGQTCGTRWTQGTWDGSYGPGQQMSAMSILQSNLIGQSRALVSEAVGGTSVGDVGGGTNNQNADTPIVYPPITTADRAGAGILTALILITIMSGVWWMLV